MGTLLEMTTIDPDNVLEQLQYHLEGSAWWRREKAKEYPDDTRNVMAAEILDTLAKTVKAVPKPLAVRYAALFEDENDGCLMVEHESETIRMVGFNLSYDTAEELIKYLLESSRRQAA